MNLLSFFLKLRVRSDVLEESDSVQAQFSSVAQHGCTVADSPSLVMMMAE